MRRQRQDPAGTDSRISTTVDVGGKKRDQTFNQCVTRAVDEGTAAVAQYVKAHQQRTVERGARRLVRVSGKYILQPIAEQEFVAEDILFAIEDRLARNVAQTRGIADGRLVGCSSGRGISHDLFYRQGIERHEAAREGLRAAQKTIGGGCFIPVSAFLQRLWDERGDLRSLHSAESSQCGYDLRRPRGDLVVTQRALGGLESRAQQDGVFSSGDRPAAEDFYRAKIL